MKLQVFLTVALAIALFSCSKKESKNTKKIAAGDDPNFKIVAHTDAGFTTTNRKVVVFNIPIYAYADVDDAKLLHAANIMAQYIDNNEDGAIDNPLVHKTLVNNRAALFLWKKESQTGKINAQDLGNDETSITWHTNGKKGRFDAALEEVFHVITHSGYSKAYPDVFGENKDSELAKAMDIARGGYFTTIPSSYPAGAWYTYDDNTCEYDCMVTEYFYWAQTSILGAQQNRYDDIKQEWKLNTKDKVKSGDKAVYKLLNDPKYKLPTILPDGTYMR